MTFVIARNRASSSSRAGGGVGAVGWSVTSSSSWPCGQRGEAVGEARLVAGYDHGVDQAVTRRAVLVDRQPAPANIAAYCGFVPKAAAHRARPLRTPPVGGHHGRDLRDERRSRPPASAAPFAMAGRATSSR